jgi:hypothetical protein
VRSVCIRLQNPDVTSSQVLPTRSIPIRAGNVAGHIVLKIVTPAS